MILLRAAVFVLITVIGTAHSQRSGVNESGFGSDDGRNSFYRPWLYDGKNVTWISLAGLGISSLNSDFRFNVPQLQWLVMDYNVIQKIPSEAFKYLSDLTYLSLASNRISQFEINAFKYLDKVRVLDLDKNQLPDDLDMGIFSDLPSLERLHLSYCGLKVFDLFEDMYNLSHLYLTGNQLTAFYANSESPLTHLYLNENALEFVSLSNLRSVVYLNMDNNRCTAISSHSYETPAQYVKQLRNPRWFSQPDKLKLLFIERSPALEYLIISSNRISRISADSFKGVEALSYLDLTNNKIRALLPGTFSDLFKLKTILLDRNEITQINNQTFVNLPNLERLSLKHNRIDEIEENAFASLKSNANEVYLYLDNNEISVLKSGSFRDINGLKYIGLSGNRITTISSGAFTNLPNLESIEIQNQLSEENIARSGGISVEDQSEEGSIESDAFFGLSNLNAITIRGNKFTDIRARAFHALPKLAILDLSNNSIANLSSEAFTDLPEIKHLYLRNNSITQIAPKTFPNTLKRLDLAWNRIPQNSHDWHIEELDHLEELDISGIIEKLNIDDLFGLPNNLTLVFGKTKNSADPIPCR